VGRVRETRPWCAGLVAVCRHWRGRLLDPYRPELHYMRGPGPRWREKHRPLVDRPHGQSA